MVLLGVRTQTPSLVSTSLSHSTMPVTATTAYHHLFLLASHHHHPPSQPPLQLFPLASHRRNLALEVAAVDRSLGLEVAVAGVNELVEDDVLRTFFEERELNGDFIAKISDKIWLKKLFKYVDEEMDMLADTTPLPEEASSNEDEGGFLKLKSTYEWVVGDNSAPVNKKLTAKELWDDSERRRRLNLLRYEAIKREMLLLTIGIGALCSGYCLVALSFQAALSYAAGVLFSCLYLQLLYQHADNLSKEMVPQIFMKKKTKKIGIRSQDLKDQFERLVKGSAIALSSPRLVIPAAVYGIWGLSQHFTSDLFDFQLVPAMVGVFAYKAAALVQVYRDNKDLQLVFPESGEE